MDKAKKNTVIHAAADRMAANYKSSQIPMYGDALRMPNRNAVIEIIRDCQKLIFPVYYGDRDLLKLPPEQYSALLMEHIHEKLTRQITLTMPECDENCEVAYAISTAFIERILAIQELLLKDLSATLRAILRLTARRRSYSRTPACSPSSSTASHTSCMRTRSR